MRKATRQRLLALLEQDYARAKARTSADHLKAYHEQEEVLASLLQEWTQHKDDAARRAEIVTQIETEQRARNRHWRAYLRYNRHLEAWVKEEFALQRDLQELHQLLASTPAYE
jgi:hypothetical protein